MTPITVIPDLHADPDRLAASLDAAGDDHIAFLGDFIDAGAAVATPDDDAVLTQVRSLVEDGRATAVMGNHELNAILFHRTDRHGAPLRARSQKNRDQHQSFLDRYGVASPEALHWTEWFLTLPLWREQHGLRLVHACWDEQAIATIAARRPDGLLHPADLQEVGENRTEFARAVDVLLKGPEARLPDGWSFLDGKDVRRTEVRVAWWMPPGGRWRDVALSVKDVAVLPDGVVPQEAGVCFYGADQPPVLAGHYKMKGRPALPTSQAASLDFPETPCVYHWRGEPALTPKNLTTLFTTGAEAGE